MKMWIVICLVSLFAVFFQLAPYTGMADVFIYCMFFLSPFLVAYMAYVILKYGKPSGHSFDERYYEDL